MSTMTSKFVRAFVRLETADGSAYEIELIDHPDQDLTGHLEMNTEPVEVDPFEHGEPWRIYTPGPRSASVSISGRVGEARRVARP